MRIIKYKIISLSFFAGVCLLGYLVFYSYMNYLDIFHLCAIKIERRVIGNDRRIVDKALVSLRKSDKEAYRTTCRYVDVISEKTCHMYSDDYGKATKLLYSGGCYIKGSKVIYVQTLNNRSVKSKEDVSSQIKKYSSMSKKFWENR